MARPRMIRADRWFDGVNLRDDEVSLILRGGQIERIEPGAHAGVEAARGAIIHDVRGHLVLPGLINAHAHVARTGGFEASEPPLPLQVARNLVGSLRAGVTTIADMGGPAGVTRALRGLAVGAPRVSPAILLSGALLTAPRGYPLDWIPGPLRRLGIVEACAGERQARAAVGRIARSGADHVKLAIMHRSYAERPLPALDVETARAIVDEAHRLGLRALAHAHGLDDYRVALSAGVDALMHSSFDPLDDETIRRIQDTGTKVCPTLWVFEAACRGAEERWDLNPRFREDTGWWLRRSWRRFAESYAASGESFPPGIAGGLSKVRAREAVRVASANLRLLHDAGVGVAFGNDAPYGFALVGRPVDELGAMQRAGLCALECLSAATSGAAALLGLGDRGRLHPGLRADIVVARASTLDDVSGLSEPLLVLAHGERVDPAATAFAVARAGSAFLGGIAAAVRDAWRSRHDETG